MTLADTALQAERKLCALILEYVAIDYRPEVFGAVVALKDALLAAQPEPTQQGKAVSYEGLMDELGPREPELTQEPNPAFYGTGPDARWKAAINSQAQPTLCDGSDQIRHLSPEETIAVVHRHVVEVQDALVAAAKAPTPSAQPEPTQDLCDVRERPIGNGPSTECPHCHTKWAEPFPGKLEPVAAPTPSAWQPIAPTTMRLLKRKEALQLLDTWIKQDQQSPQSEEIELRLRSVGHSLIPLLPMPTMSHECPVISESSKGPSDTAPYVPAWCYAKGPRICPCGHHEGYHADSGACLLASRCGCPGLPPEFLTPMDEMRADAD